VRADLPGGVLVLDPFNRGKSIGNMELKFRASTHRGREDEQISDDELFELLAPCSKRAMLIRMLMNLKSLYQQQFDVERALRVTDRLVLLSQSDFERRDRGLLYAQLGAHHAAKADLGAYLQAYPEASDAADVRAALVHSQGGRLH
jgi:regulator of sirC expression with transglutaminase-like and TPR domain